VRATGTPISRLASALPPDAYTKRPNLVRASVQPSPRYSSTVNSSGTGNVPMRPEPIQLKPGTSSGAVNPPVSTSARPVTTLIMPSVTISGFNFNFVANSPLIAPISAPTSSAATEPNQTSMPLPCSRATITPAMPATAATDRSRPPAIINGVCAALIRPMNAMLAPMLIMLSNDRNHGDNTLNVSSTAR